MQSSAAFGVGWVNAETLGNLGTLGLVAGMMLFLYWLFASGRIMTRSAVDQILVSRDKYADKQDDTITNQQETITTLLDANHILRHQNTMLIEANRIINDFFAKTPVTGSIRTHHNEGSGST